MRTFTILMIILVFAFCTARYVSKPEKVFNNLSSDTLLVQRLSEQSVALNIPQISEGVDSFELRIWHGITIATPKQLIILKYQNATCHLSLTNYWINHEWENGRPQKVVFDSSFNQSLQTPSSISRIVDSIIQFRLDTFPSQKEISNFRNRVADGMFYEIEIATPHYYKALIYNNPKRYTDSFNRRFADLLITLEKIGVHSPF